MNRYEIDYYDDVSKIKETLKRIAEALEAGNVTKAKEISGENTGLLTAKAILDSVKVITDDYASKRKDIPGFEGTWDELEGLTSKKDYLCRGSMV